MEKLPLQILLLVSEYVSICESIDFLTEKEHLILQDHERRTFEQNLPKLIKDREHVTAYTSHMIEFMAAGKYLEFLPEIIDNILKDEELQISTYRLPDVIYNCNYNNWFTTNKEGLLKFLKSYPKKNTLRFITTTNDAITYGQTIFSLIKTGKIINDPIYLEFFDEEFQHLLNYFYVKDVREIRNNLTNIAINVKEYKRGRDSLLEYAYNNLLYFSINHVSKRDIVDGIFKYVVPFYNLELKILSTNDDTIEYLCDVLCNAKKDSNLYKLIKKEMPNVLAYALRNSSVKTLHILTGAHLKIFR